MKVTVIYAADNTTKTDVFECHHASAQVFGDGRGTVSMTSGSDEHGPVSDVLYSHVWRIERRP